jgi:hypothetical protein
MKLRNRIYAIIDNKIYECESGAKAYILDVGMLNGVEKDKLLEYVEFVHYLYLKDQNPTPLGHLCDYIAEHWEEVQELDKWTILEDFYETLN